MPVRKANAQWQGDLKSGKGNMSLPCGCSVMECCGRRSKLGQRKRHAPTPQPRNVSDAAVQR